jgi:hypothetical protein
LNDFSNSFSIMLYFVHLISTTIFSLPFSAASALSAPRSA